MRTTPVLQSKHRHRGRPDSRGAVLPLAIAVMFCFALAAAAITLAGSFIAYNRVVNVATEAAALSAARDLSTIVIDDPHFGWVSLTDWPAGKQTVSPAGDLIPVLGINTILSSCRSNLLIAKHLNNQEMRSLALRDLTFASQTRATLEAACAASLAEAGGAKPTDRDGRTVDAYSDAQSSFQSNLPESLQHRRLLNFALSLGWISGPCTSGAPVPLPYTLSDASALVASDGTYSAFVDVPAWGQDFYFTGLATKTSLVPATLFNPADATQISSVVRVDAAVDTGLALNHTADSPGWTATGAACAIPGANQDLVPPAVLCVNFPQFQLPPQINTLADILGNNQICNQACPADIAEGDYPSDAGSTLAPDPQYTQTTVGQLSALGVYDWLRSCHGKENLDSLEQTLLARFAIPPQDGEYFCYCLNADGTVNESVGSNGIGLYSRQDTLDQQDSALLLSTWTFTCRDEVSRLGTEGGKHCGRPLVPSEMPGQILQMYPQNGLAVEIQFQG